MEGRITKTFILKDKVNINNQLSYEVHESKNRVYGEIDLKEGINLEED